MGTVAMNFLKQDHSTYAQKMCKQHKSKPAPPPPPKLTLGKQWRRRLSKFKGLLLEQREAQSSYFILTKKHTKKRKNKKHTRKKKNHKRKKKETKTPKTASE